MASAVLIPLAISAGLSGLSAAVQLLVVKRSDPKPVERGRNDDIRIVGYDYGAPIYRLWGQIRSAPHMIFSTGIRIEKITNSQRVGGKGSSTTQTTIDYNYYTTVQLLCCKNPVNQVTRIWANADIIYSRQPDPNLQFFEAEDGTLVGDANVVADAFCSSGQKVTDITGPSGGGESTVIFNINGPVAPSDASTSSYTLITLYYKSDIQRNIGVRTDAGSTTETVQPTGNTPQTKVVRVSGHTNTLELFQSGAKSPDIDRVTIWFSYLDDFPEDIPVTGIYDDFAEYPADEFYSYAKYNYRPENDANGVQSFSTPNTQGIRVYTGTATQGQDSALVAEMDKRFGAGQGVNYISAHRGCTYVVLEDQLIANGNLPNYTIEVNQGTTAVDQIVKDLYAEKDIQAADVDVTALAGKTLNGLIVHEQQSPNDVIAKLESWFQFKMVEMDGKVGKALLNRSPGVFTITRDDLRAFIDQDAPPESDAEIIPLDEKDLPVRTYVDFLDEGLDGKNNTQQSDLYASTLAREILKITFPFLSNETQGKAVAEQLMLQAHARRNSLALTALPKFCKYAPGDCGTVVLENASHEVQIVREQKSVAGTVNWSLQSVEEANIVGDVSDKSTTQDLLVESPLIPANTELCVFESQPIELTDEGLGVYVAVSGKGVGKWEGAGIHNKIVTEEDWQPLTRISDAAGIAVAQNILGDFAGAGEDTGNSLTLYFYDTTTLSSSTPEKLGRATANLIRVGGEWVQFRTAVAAVLPVGSNYKSAWVISNLKRGWFGTTNAKATHGADEKAALYEGMLFIALDSQYKDQAIQFKAVTFGQLLDDAPSTTITLMGLSLKGQAPADLKPRIDPMPCPIVTQENDADNTGVDLCVRNYPRITQYRKFRWSEDPALLTGVTQQILNAESEGYSNFELPEIQRIETISNPVEVTKYIGVSHSIDGEENSYGAECVVPVIFPIVGGTPPPADAPPTFTSAIFTTPNIVLVFLKNGSATGNIRVRYKETTSSQWITHSTEFAHGAVGGNIVITAQINDVTYDLELEQVGVSGVSIEKKQVIVTGTGGPSYNPPEILDLIWSDPDEIEVLYDEGTHPTNGHTVIYKKSSESQWITATGNDATSPYTIIVADPPTFKTLYAVRISQNGVPGFSEAFVFSSGAIGGGGGEN